MSDEEIVERTNDLANKFYAMHGYTRPVGFRFDEAIHPQERLMWQMAAEAMQSLLGTDADDAAASVWGDSAGADPAQNVIIDYTNWKGKRRERRIRPLQIVFENNEWRPHTQWLLEAVDLDTGQERTFSMATIHSWREMPDNQRGAP